MTPVRPRAENSNRSSLKAALRVCLVCREKNENATRIGAARENLARASATGGISFNANRMKMNDPAQVRMIVVKKTNEVSL